jgi:N-carbamoyl-L-amino-acid hydrolase
MAEIDPGRLLRDLRRLADFGRSGAGVSRPAYSEADLRAREWLCERLAEAGLDARVDGAGNVYGRAPGASRAILMGSHTDTVRAGGWLDGSLGVVCALEIARALGAPGARGEVGVDVVSFADEEGTWEPWFGSRCFCGELTPGAAAAARSGLGAALAALAGRPLARLEPGRHLAYLEAHIEQGPRLEAAGKTIGVVGAIVGIRDHRLEFAGRADHAGTTPMAERRDAGRALIEAAGRLLAGFERARGPETVWNLGRIALEPGEACVVPARAELLLEYRDPDEATLARFDELVRAEVAQANESGIACRLTTERSVPPVRLDAALASALRTAAEACRAGWLALSSGAGHDAAVLARHVPSAMMFVPSIAGRSHRCDEDTAEADLVLGARVALAWVEEVRAAAACGVGA